MLSSALTPQQLITGCTVQHFRASDGLSLAYTIDDFTDPWLKAPTLLLLHAAMGHSKRYYAWVPKLCRHYRVVRMDLRGHGESEVPAAEPPLTMERLVQDVREMLDHLGTPSAHIVGNSAGGYIGQQLAIGERKTALDGKKRIRRLLSPRQDAYIESEIIAKPTAYLVAVFGIAECACTHCCHLLDAQGPALVNESLQHVQGAPFRFR